MKFLKKKNKIKNHKPIFNIYMKNFFQNFFYIHKKNKKGYMGK